MAVVGAADVPQPDPVLATVTSSPSSVPTTAPEEAGANTERPQLVPTLATATTSPLPVPSATPLQPAVVQSITFPEDAFTFSFPDPPPPPSPTDAHTHATLVDQGTLDLAVPDHQGCHLPPGAINPPVTITSLPADAGARWMRSKGTLEYFRRVDKIGQMSNLILHWYQLEEALGFPDPVSVLTTYYEKPY